MRAARPRLRIAGVLGPLPADLPLHLAQQAPQVRPGVPVRRPPPEPRPRPRRDHLALRLLKNELAAGVYPSDKYRANAAWLRLQSLP